MDCEGKVRACKVCQVFARRPGRPVTYYQPVSNVVPFARWGIDLIGQFPVTYGRCKFVIVAIDYFTKWVEAEPLATITAQHCKRFVWRNIISRFGVPVQIVTDNGRQFDSKQFKEFLHEFGVNGTRVAVAYPQANGQVENANRTILDGIKKRLEDAGSNWLDELQHVLWAFRTTRKVHNVKP